MQPQGAYEGNTGNWG